MNSVKSDFDNLQQLLASWNLIELQSHFKDEDIGIEELQMMKPHHIVELLRNFKLGIRIKFEHHFEKWRRNLHKPLETQQQLQHSINSKIVYCQSPLKNQPLLSTVNCTNVKEKSPLRVETWATKNVQICDTIDLSPDGSSTRNSYPSPKLSEIQPTAFETQQPATGTPMASSETAAAFKEIPKLTLQSQFQPQTLSKQTQNRALEKLRPIVQSDDPLTTHSSTPPPLKKATLQLFENQSPYPLSVLRILQTAGPKGTSLLNFYEKHHKLTPKHRTLLMHLIVSFFESNDFHLSLNTSHRLEEQILKLFPSEKLINYRTEKRGKIYVKFCNMKRYKREKTTKHYVPSYFNAEADNEHQDVQNMEDDDDLSISYDDSSWCDPAPPPVEVQVKTENLSEDGF